MAESTDYIELMLAGHDKPVKIPLDGVSAKDRKKIKSRVDGVSRAVVTDGNINAEVRPSVRPALSRSQAQEGPAAQKPILQAQEKLGGPAPVVGEFDPATGEVLGGPAPVVGTFPPEPLGSKFNPRPGQEVLGGPAPVVGTFPPEKPAPPGADAAGVADVGSVMPEEQLGDPAPEVGHDPRPDNLGNAAEAALQGISPLAALGSHIDPSKVTLDSLAQATLSTVSPPLAALTRHPEAPPPLPNQDPNAVLPPPQTPGAEAPHPPMVGLPAEPAPVDWNRLIKENKGYIDAQQQAIQGRAELEKSGLNAEAEVQRHAQATAAQMAADEKSAQVARQDALNKYTQAYTSLTDQRIALSKEAVDPNRWWNNKTDGQKAASYIAAALFGFSGHGMEYLNSIDAAIERDVRLQQSEFERKDRALGAAVQANDSLYARARNAGLDAQAAYHAARAQLFQDTSMQVDTIAKQTGAETAKQNAALLSGQLQQGGVKEEASLLGYAQQHADHIYSTRLQTALQMMKMTAAQGKAGPGGRAPAQVLRAMGQVQGSINRIKALRAKLDSGGVVGDILTEIQMLNPFSAIHGEETAVRTGASGAAKVGGDSLKDQVHEIQATGGLGLKRTRTSAMLKGLQDGLEEQLRGYQQNIDSDTALGNLPAGGVAETPLE